MPKHLTLSGHEIEFPRPSPKVAAFLDRLRAMLDDRKATENDMIALAYSKENPLLDPTIFPTRGAVTKEVLANPIYSVVTDLLSRKRVAEEGIDVDAIAKQHTISVAEAAAELGITEGAVRAAIAARKMPSWVKDGRYYLTARALRAYDVQHRGPERKDQRSEAEAARERRAAARDAPSSGEDVDENAAADESAVARVDHALLMRIGNMPGKSFRVRYPGTLEGETRDAEHTHIVHGRLVDGWHSVAIIAGRDDKYRFWALEPGDEYTEVAFEPFYVRGNFRIVAKINNAAEARDAWKAFTAR